ncbi:hypothetical protein L1987_03830 [Smallanthus sonchifolius]|uniref:Uncharacterized protein n=1 Tax=Smallanthus sonchifolius TaxID=185202 RepID=A0ACB9KBS4_9ASTR|nr:hypothetical protein L1987_03830 [Smallanthus sonchifolius]
MWGAFHKHGVGSIGKNTHHAFCHEVCKVETIEAYTGMRESNFAPKHSLSVDQTKIDHKGKLSLTTNTSNTIKYNMENGNDIFPSDNSRYSQSP